ncbi:Alpha/Beta hydrolase protein [Dactylonectria estremocensis]|uniref:Alpha/Beta hydrolase protein n=1 Tax=Dactylonectria estremocensis TaxID=1079267 RepID=A0A9P9FJL4_9HYPO|nr:Alpha/Beta hydrolase protein [Dactylonectria estremocensis]
MLSKSTEVYANHGMPIECDIYSDSDYPEDAPVFLYFHPGGLVDWGRDCLAPWLVQSCRQRQWPLISAGFRQMPQVGARGLLDDVTAAYKFAREWQATEGRERRVIVGGASGGFLTAALVAHHCTPPPIALFSISGIATFRHPFFNSSTLLTPEPLADADMAPVIALPLAVGKTPAGSPSAFVLDKLLADGSKNPDYQPPEEARRDETKPTRGALYDYYIYKNAWVDLLGEVDVGYDWARDASNKARLEAWPPTVIFHGDDDPDVPLDVSQQVQKSLGKDKVKIFVAEGQSHLFELISFVEDDGPGMGAVRDAFEYLGGIVAGIE